VIEIAPHPKSPDSRYFGSISTSQIIAFIGNIAFHSVLEPSTLLLLALG